jgi:5,10-methenyltetrahydromethanopterin hydrogenase
MDGSEEGEMSDDDGAVADANLSAADKGKGVMQPEEVRKFCSDPILCPL